MASITVVGLNMVPRDEPRRDNVTTDAVPTEETASNNGRRRDRNRNRDNEEETENTNTGNDTIDLNLDGSNIFDRGSEQ